MQRKLKIFLCVLLSLAMIFCISCGTKSSSKTNTAPPITGKTSDTSLNNKHKQKTAELMSMINHNPDLKALLEKSIEKAKQINPNKKTNPVQSLKEYYDYVDWACTAMPYAILRGVEENYVDLYDKIDQSLDYFYFLNDQPLEELKNKGYYYNSIQYHEPYRSWMIDFTEDYGKFLNTTKSWNDGDLEEAKSSPKFGLNDDTYEDPSNWHTFNQFFARYLKSPDKRPIAAKNDDSIVVSPADSKPQGIWHIGEDNKLQNNETVSVKSGVFSNVSVLLGDSKYKDSFAGGEMTHTFLDVFDYHRYHFPVSGKIVDCGFISRDDAADGITVWDKKEQRYVLHSEEPGWQMIETRGYVVLDTEKYGLVAVLPIGMSQISSVCFEDTVKIGNTVKKGDMLGCFLFGGSDIIMLFQKNANFKLSLNKNNEGKYDHILTGTQYGKMQSKK